MAFPKKLKELCTPAFIYFVLSVIGILVTLVANMGNKNMYTLGNFSSRVPNTMLVFIVKIVYVLFFTWILNLMCKDGHKEIAWFLVLLPFIFYFLVIVFVGKSSYEGFEDAVTMDANPEEEEKDKMEGFTTKKTHMGLSVSNGY